MTYSSGGLIEAADYNTFQTNLNTVWSTGSTDSGWGQTALPSVSSAGVITASNWASLVDTLATSGSQTTTTLTARTAPVTGNVVAILPDVATDITSVTANRGYATSSGTISSTWTGDVSNLTGTNPGTGDWLIQWIFSINLAPDGAGGDAARNMTRYFWNAGGLIRLDMEKTSTGTAIDADWNTFVDTVGTLYLSGRVNNANQVIAGVTYTGFTRIGGSGTPSPNLTTTGWWQLPHAGLTPASVELFKLYNTVIPYTGSYIQVQAQLSSAGGGLPADARSPQMQIVVNWYQPALAGSTQISGGTNTTSPFTAFGTGPTVLCRFIPPSTAQGLSQSWMNPTVVASVSPA